MKELHHKTYRFAQYQLDATRRLLLCAGKRVALNAKAFDVLLALVEHGGQVMTKAELMNQVWQEQFVEEANLAVQVSALRKTLGKMPDEQPFIVTIPGRGYSFVAEVQTEAAQPEILIESQTTSQILIEDETIVEQQSRASETTYLSPVALKNEEIGSVVFEANQRIAQPQSVAIAPASIVAPQKLSALHRQILAGVMALVVLAVGVVVYVQLFQFRKANRQVNPSPPITLRRFDTHGGVPDRVAISPDGKSLVYRQRLKGKDALWLGQIETNSSVPIYERANYWIDNLAFAPDGNSIYFTINNSNPPQPLLVRMPIVGGAITELTQNVASAITFSPDGRQIAFLRRDEEKNQMAMLIADADNGHHERLLISRQSPHGFSGEGLSWSPDGKTIASSVNTSTGRDELVTINVADGSVNKIGSRDWGSVENLVWLPDSSGLFVLAKENTGERRRQIWLVSYPDGEGRQISNDLNIFLLPQMSVSANGKLAVLQGQINSSVWIAPQGNADAAHRLLQGVAPRYEGVDGLAWMPDGRLLYTAYVGDSLVIWMMNSDGSNLKQLTPAKAHASDGNLSVTADGRYIVFQSNRSGSPEIWRVNADGSNLKQLTSGGNNSQPNSSPDDRWIIYLSTRDGKPTLWRMPIDGGEAIQLTDKSASCPQVSSDGKYIAAFLSSSTSPGFRLTIIPFAGGEPIKSFAVPETALRGRRALRWMPDGKAILYIDNLQGLWRQALDEETPQMMKGFDELTLRQFVWSFDGRNLAYTSGVATQEIILIENFK